MWSLAKGLQRTGVLFVLRFVEVLSPADDVNAVIAKVTEFLDCGVPRVWLVDPESRLVTVYRSLSDTRRLSAEDTTSGGGVLPGFRSPVARLFDEARPDPGPIRTDVGELNCWRAGRLYRSRRRRA